jgi:hypothetical protein
VGICALFWAIWNCRNDNISQDRKGSLFINFLLSPPGGAARLQVLATAVWRWFLWISTTRMAGDILKHYMMHGHLLFNLYFFCKYNGDGHHFVISHSIKRRSFLQGGMDITRMRSYKRSCQSYIPSFRLGLSLCLIKPSDYLKK